MLDSKGFSIHIEEVMPWRIRKYADVQHRKYTFRRAMRTFVRDPSRSIGEPGGVLSELVYGWGNEAWSAGEEYLRGCLEHAFQTNGPILECGSGLSTILLGKVAQETGNVVWSLEHTTIWSKKVVDSLERYGIPSRNLCVCPLKDYGDFYWYAPPMELMPSSFSMVVCDGPPGNTKGGRYGLVSVMRSKLRHGTTIFLDDAARDHEKTLAARWADELQADCKVRGLRKPYFSITVPNQESE